MVKAFLKNWEPTVKAGALFIIFPKGPHLFSVFAFPAGGLMIKWMKEKGNRKGYGKGLNGNELKRFSIFSALALFAAAFRLTGSVFVATGAARILSAAANYCINRNAVFSGRGKTAGVSAVRYGVLCAGIAVLSALSVSVSSAVLRIRPETAKVFCDAVLFFISYRVQKRWVFR